MKAFTLASWLIGGLFGAAAGVGGFHAPQEALRVLAQSIDLARRGQLALRPLPAR